MIRNAPPPETRPRRRALRRTGAVLAVLLAVAGCRAGAPAGAVTATAASLLPAAVSTQNAGDSRAAKALFGVIPRASQQAPAPIGFYSRGCAAGNVQMPESGPTWQAMRLSRNRNWTQPYTMQFLQDLSRASAQIPGSRGLYIGDMSQPRGGPMDGGHVSHQSGLEADVWLRLPDRLDLSVQTRETISSTVMDRGNGAYVNDNWTAAQEALVRAAASDPRVDRIFIFPAAKVAMCDHATGDRSWLRRVRPWYGHNSHFHVRLACPPGAANCEAQDPMPAGDGCEDARQWVRDIIDPPPPNPDYVAPPPRGEITMATLPSMCLSVLNSD